MFGQLHVLLKRQLKKHFGSLENIPKGLKDFIAAVNEAYIGFDSDRILLERSIEISSQELMQSVSLLAATLEASADGILVVDLNGKVVTYNHKFLDLWHIPDSLIAAHDDKKLLEYALTQLASPEEFTKKVEELYSNPQAQSSDLIFFKDGRVFDRFSQPQKIGEKIVGRVWSFRDISERKEIEESLQESENYLKTVFNSLQIGIIMVDAETHLIADANPVAVRLFGASKENIVGVLCHDFICPAEKGKCPITDLHQQVDNAERVLVTADGRQLPVLKTVVTITLRNRKFFLESFVDISGRKKAEEEREKLIGELKEQQELLREQKEELEDSRRAIKNVAEDLAESKEILEYQNKSLEDINKELDDFTYIVSHDLKEPLRSIDAYSKFITEDYRDKLGEEARHYLERIRTNTERMQKLIEDLLEISRLKRKGSTIEEVGAEELIGEVKMRLEYAIKQKGAQIIIKDSLPDIFCDRVRFTEVFLNLISNALKFNDKE
ncbi:MAG: PAS domain S-box protein, partial [Candidatus Omnitrophica bacterium]|nr:PAS domain S-box protein [Candidatus Omnitrophota bacterium]